jgi:hypothetical protein
VASRHDAAFRSPFRSSLLAVVLVSLRVGPVAFFETVARVLSDGGLTQLPTQPLTRDLALGGVALTAKVPLLVDAPPEFFKLHARDLLAVRHALRGGKWAMLSRR